MSSGPADCAAEDELYRQVENAVFAVRTLCRLDSHRMCHYRVSRVNEIIADEHGYQFCLAQYAKSEVGNSSWPSAGAAEQLWHAAFRLRQSLIELNWGHRGWSPALDPQMGYLLNGTGYVLVRGRA